MESVRIHVLPMCFSFFGFIGEIGVRALCRGWFYEPKIPKELTDYVEG